MDEEHSSPLCSLVESNEENDYYTARKRLRKKGNVAAERSDKNNVGVGVCLTHSEKKSRRGRREREDVQEVEQRVPTPQKKKQKKNISVTDSSSLSSLTRTSTAEKFRDEPRGRNTVNGNVVSGFESSVCLTHTNSSMKNRSKTSMTMSRKLPRKPSESGESLSSAGGGFRRKLTFSSSRDHTDRNVLTNKLMRKSRQNIPNKAKKTSNTKVAKKHKLKTSIDDSPIGLDAELLELQEDVVVTSAAGDHVGGQISSVRCTKSKANDKLFVEYAGGFTSSKKSKVQRRRLQMATEGDAHRDIFVVPSPQTTSSFGLATHRSFVTFTLFCQGLFAGVALWHMISVQYFIAQGNHILLRQYGKMAKPLESLYYLMFALSTVAAFDRYDVQRPSTECIHLGLSMHTGALSTVCYSIGVIIHLVASKTDDRISLSPIKWDLWPTMEERDDTLGVWWSLCMARGIFAILGWAFIVVTPHVDLLTTHLEDTGGALLGEECDAKPAYGNDV